MSKTGFLVKSVASGQISPKLTFTKMTLFIYGPMQLDELIPNITIVFRQSVMWMPKIGFSTRHLGFLDILENSLGKVS
jgi:hypothetical protein